MKLNITASCHTGTEVLATARTLKNLAKRLERDAQLWRDMGWECFRLTGFTAEDAQAAVRNRDVTVDEYRTLLAQLPSKTV